MNLVIDLGNRSILADQEKQKLKMRLIQQLNIESLQTLPIVIEEYASKFLMKTDLPINIWKKLLKQEDLNIRYPQ